MAANGGSHGKPNVLITGTPGQLCLIYDSGHVRCGVSGTGKSLTASELCSRTGMRQVDVGLVAKQQNLFDGFDEQYQCPILDEDRVCVCVFANVCVCVFANVCVCVCVVCCRWWMSWRR